MNNYGWWPQLHLFKPRIPIHAAYNYHYCTFFNKAMIAGICKSRSLLTLVRSYSYYWSIEMAGRPEIRCCYCVSLQIQEYLLCKETSGEGTVVESSNIRTVWRHVHGIVKYKSFKKRSWRTYTWLGGVRLLETNSDLGTGKDSSRAPTLWKLFLICRKLVTWTDGKLAIGKSRCPCSNPTQYTSTQGKSYKLSNS